MKPLSQREPLIHEYNDEPTYLTLASSAPGTRQSFAQNALSKRSRASVACGEKFHQLSAFNLSFQLIWAPQSTLTVTHHRTSPHLPLPELETVTDLVRIFPPVKIFSSRLEQKIFNFIQVFPYHSSKTEKSLCKSSFIKISQTFNFRVLAQKSP